MVAKSSLFFSTRSASFINKLPRSVGDIFFHDGSFRAFRAALTARSTSSAPAAYTDVISCSFLCAGRSVRKRESDHVTYVGLIEMILSLDLDATNSLFMKSPVGWVYVRPLGAVSSTESVAILSGFDSLLNENSRALKNMQVNESQ